ncbi:MAG TPA: hypothetical protein PKD72_13280, partial [Gemmatales bacterium]|nr:hypothetical protein [Gemmatales bacterium]
MDWSADPRAHVTRPGTCEQVHAKICKPTFIKDLSDSASQQYVLFNVVLDIGMIFTKPVRHKEMPQFAPAWALIKR